MTHRSFAAALALLISGVAAWADSPVPGDGFGAAHYEPLWTKSPFAVASADAPASSPDYKLIGLGRIDGVSYAIVLETQTNEHFMVTSDKPVKGITLVSVTRQSHTSDASAIIKKDGEPLTLKLEQSTQFAGPLPPMENGSVPNMPPTAYNAPTYNPSGGGGQAPPQARFRPRLTIHLPPSPTAAQTPPPPPPAATTTP